MIATVIGVGAWYFTMNRRLNKLLTDKNTLLQSVEKLANHDFLTKLPNRRLIYDRIEKSIRTASRSETKVAICLIDLNGFKKINDDFGHLVGDQVLIEVGKRLEYWVRSSDSIGRIGGDEFLICMEDIHQASDINAPIDRLKQEFESPFLVGNQKFHLSFSVGAAIYPEDGNQPDVLIHHADNRMYQNKKGPTQSDRRHEEIQ